MIPQSLSGPFPHAAFNERTRTHTMRCTGRKVLSKPCKTRMFANLLALRRLGAAGRAEGGLGGKPCSPMIQATSTVSWGSPCQSRQGGMGSPVNPKPEKNPMIPSNTMLAPQVLMSFTGLPAGWGARSDVQLLLDAHEQGYYPGGKRKPRGPAGKGFVETFLTDRCACAPVRARAPLTAPPAIAACVPHCKCQRSISGVARCHALARLPLLESCRVLCGNAGTLRMLCTRLFRRSDPLRRRSPRRLQARRRALQRQLPGSCRAAQQQATRQRAHPRPRPALRTCLRGPARASLPLPRLLRCAHGTSMLAPLPAMIYAKTWSCGLWACGCAHDAQPAREVMRMARCKGGGCHRTPLKGLLPKRGVP